MANDMDRARAINARVEALRALSGSETFGHLTGLLELLRDQYLLDLADVSPADLGRKQGALKQVMALHECITGRIGGSPRT